MFGFSPFPKPKVQKRDCKNEVVRYIERDSSREMVELTTRALLMDLLGEKPPSVCGVCVSVCVLGEGGG